MAISHRAMHYQLATRGDLDQLLADLGVINAGTLLVQFDQFTGFEPTDLELARLVARARDHDCRLVIESSDSSLTDRAVRLGFHDAGELSDWTESRHDVEQIPAEGDEKSPPDEPDVVYDTTASLATYKPVAYRIPASSPLRQIESETTPALDVPDETEAGDIDTVVFPTEDGEVTPFSDGNGRQPRRIKPAREFLRRKPAPIANPPRWVENDPVQHDDPDELLDAPTPVRSRRRRPRRKGLILAAAIVAPLLVIAVVGALAVYLLPTAEVSIVPVEDAVASSLTYGVANSAEGLDIVFDPTPHSATLTADATRDATGERFEPDGTASATIQVTNPFTSEVTVPAGTEISGPNGVTYYTSQDLVIPAADPFGARSFGSAEIGIYAGIAGPDGNLDAGALTGQLGTGLFYTNMTPASGGTMRSIPVIDHADVEAVTEEVRVALIERAEEEFYESIPEGYQPVPGTVTVDGPDIDVTASGGEDGTDVSASGSIRVRGEIFDPAELHEYARDEAGRMLAGQGGGDRILLANSVDIAEPEAMNEDRTAFAVEANARARKVITVEEQEQLASLLVGKSRAEAEELLAENPRIASFNVNISPDWLPDRMPEVVSRIDVRVTAGDQVATAR